MYASGASHKTSDIESFIEYKINNKQKSQSEARALALKNKHQIDLDKRYKQLDAKYKEVKHVEYETKKVKKQVWDQLLLISSTTEKLQKQKYEYTNKMRMAKEAKDETQRKLKQNHQQAIKKEEQLLRMIEETKDNSQEYFYQKEAIVEELMRNKQVLREKIKEKEATLKQYYDKKFGEEILVQQIERMKGEKLDLISSLKTLKQQKEALDHKAMETIKHREQQQMKASQIKKQLISKFIQQINIMLAEKASEKDKPLQNLLQDKKQQLNHKSQQKQLPTQKYQQLKTQMTSTQRQPTLLSINQQLFQYYNQQINNLKKQLEQVQSKQKQKQKRCQQLIEEEAAREKEVHNLQETAKKISQNLDKK